MADLTWLKGHLENQGSKLGDKTGTDPNTGAETYTYTDPNQPTQTQTTTVTPIQGATGNTVLKIEVVKTDRSVQPPLTYKVETIDAEYPPNAGPNDPPSEETITFYDKDGMPTQKFENEYKLDPKAPFGRRIKRQRIYKWNPRRGAFDLEKDNTFASLVVPDGDGPQLVAIVAGTIVDCAEIALSVSCTEPMPERDDRRQQQPAGMASKRL